MAKKKERGRPSTFTRRLADEITRRMSQGETLKEICRNDGMPPESTVRRWALDDREGFYALYARAREMQVERWADELVEIADDGTNDWQERQVGEGRVETVPDTEHINRSRLRVDTRKWLMSKLVPRTYGDKAQVEHTGKDGGPIEHSIEARQREAQALLAAVFDVPGAGDG